MPRPALRSAICSLDSALIERVSRPAYGDAGACWAWTPPMVASVAAITIQARDIDDLLSEGGGSEQACALVAGEGLIARWPEQDHVVGVRCHALHLHAG